jgi:hypothetical protein
VPGYLVDIFCVCDIDSASLSSGGGSSSSSSSNTIATACLKALRACIIDHPSCKKVRRPLFSPAINRATVAIPEP